MPIEDKTACRSERCLEGCVVSSIDCNSARRDVDRTRGQHAGSRSKRSNLQEKLLRKVSGEGSGTREIDEKTLWGVFGRPKSFQGRSGTRFGRVQGEKLALGALLGRPGGSWPPQDRLESALRGSKGRSGRGWGLV